MDGSSSTTRILPVPFTSAPLMTSTLPRRPVNLLRSRGEGHPQHLRSGAEAPSNPTAAWWLVNPGDPGRTKGATMLSRVKKVALGVAAVSGAAAGDVTTDYFGNGYEVTVTKSDGSTVEYHLDSSFNVMAHPTGGPGGWG